MKKLKIVICHDRAIFKEGGVDRATIELANAFKRLGHEPIIIYKYGSKPKISNMESHKIKFPQLPFFNTLYFSIKLYKLIRRLNPDLVITQENSAPILGKLKQKHFHIIHNLEWLEIKNADKDIIYFTERPIMLFLEKVNSKRSDGVLTLNKGLAKDVKKFHNVSPKIIKWGINTEKFKPLKTKTPNKIPRIICVTTKNKKRKNLQILIDACKSLNVKLRLTNCPFKNLPSNVMDLGFISDKKLIEELQKADLFVLPSKQESFGLATLEALSCNTPVLLTKTGIWKEIVKNKTGEVVSGTVKELKKGIKKILRTNYKDKPRKLAEQYSWEKTAESILKIIK